MLLRGLMVHVVIQVAGGCQSASVSNDVAVDAKAVLENTDAKVCYTDHCNSQICCSYSKNSSGIPSVFLAKHVERKANPLDVDGPAVPAYCQNYCYCGLCYEICC